MLKRPFSRLTGFICFILLCLPRISFAADAIAQLPIYGGLGIEFAKPLEGHKIGAEVSNIGAIPHNTLPSNRKIDLPNIEPGGTHPWRVFTQPTLPRPLRGLSYVSYVMLDDLQHPIRATLTVQESCGKKYQWIKETLTNKYQVHGEIDIEVEEPLSEGLRIRFSDKQIDIYCGKQITMQYLDFAALRRWAVAQHKRYQVHEREIAAQKKRQLILNRRRSLQFANEFTIGDQYKLDGAFGVFFQQPFAKNSTQKFPFDIPFFAVLPSLPEEFSNGDIQLVISPEKHPIVIRGTFKELEFERVKNALRAKYGTPLKSTDRHVIHKVSDRHAILKRMSLDTIELAFIDTTAQSEQRRRLWEQETEGL